MYYSTTFALRSAKLALACMAVLGYFNHTCTADGSTERAGKEYVYVWYPRSTDVPHSDAAPETVVLRVVLKLVSIDSYVVKNGDSLNYILRQKYFVSESRPKAYSLYIARIKELNPALPDLNKLRPRTVIKLPHGPKFGASEIGLHDVPNDVKTRWFQSLSAKAYFSDANKYKVKTHALREKVQQSLGYLFQRNKNSTLPLPDELLAQVQERGIVPAVDVDTHPETELAQVQTYHLASSGSTDDSSSLDALISNEKNGHLLPSSVSEVLSANASCNNQCTACAEILKLPSNLDWSNARVLITDTGLDTNTTGLTNPAVNLMGNGNGQNISDVSTEHHGTFVFSEIAKSGKGPIPDEHIYIARVAAAAAGGANFDLAGVLNAWASFNETEANSSSNGPRTWIANISAEGGSAPGTVPEPVIPFGPNLLVIAAAGNESSGDITTNDIFPRLSNPNSNLIVVGALAQDGNKATYSNWHANNVQLFSRGDCVCGVPGQLNGTSQATPIVTVAAAALASARPDWYAPQVMWRLLATSDRPDNLVDFCFAGVVNAPRALGPALVVRSDDAQGGIAEDAGSQVTFDQEWTAKINDNAKNLASTYVLLRLTDRAQVGGEVCFTPIRYRLFFTKRICVSPTAQMTLTGTQGVKSFTADHLEDVILPMNGDRKDALPVISSTHK